MSTVRSLGADFVLSVVDQGIALFGAATASFTGGEPLLHPEFGRIVEGLHARAVGYRFVSNGWHTRRAMPTLDRYPPDSVRLSLSGADAGVHDAERGRDSFRRVLLSVALLTSRRIPAWFSIIIDRRTRHQVREVADLAESLGCIGLQYILPQPVPASLERDTDLGPAEWWEVTAEVEALSADRARRTVIELSYGHPFMGDERSCSTFALDRLYVDAFGRLSLCCQLSDYGANERDVVADLQGTSLADAWPLYTERLGRLRADMESIRGTDDAVAPFPCLRCARACGKLDWMRRYPNSSWGRLETGRDPRALPVLAAFGAA